MEGLRDGLQGLLQGLGRGSVPCWPGSIVSRTMSRLHTVSPPVAPAIGTEAASPGGVAGWLRQARRWAGSSCQVCRRWQTDALCVDCLGRFAPARPRCRGCAIVLPHPEVEFCGRCLREPSALTAVVTALDYGFPWDRLISRFKFHAAPELAGDLADLLTGAVAPALRSGWLERPEWVLPVPLSPQRLRERGYNQAWELARRVARAQGLSARADLLVKLREGAHQAELSREERLHNLAAAFATEPQARPLLAGARVALVDDVMTTGATLQELARTLLRAGASQVQGWVLARTPE
jgi:ComF family protein